MSEDVVPRPARRGPNAILAISTTLVTLGTVEGALRVFWPVEDPFERLKAQAFVNQYIRSAFGAAIPNGDGSRRGPPRHHRAPPVHDEQRGTAR